MSGHILLAPDKFKGSLDAAGVASALARGIADADPAHQVRRCPVADGGDGTVAAAVAAGWQEIRVATTGPTGSPLVARYARRDRTALVELATTSGLALLPAEEFAPVDAGTEGLGVLLVHALERGAEEVVIGLGGSATTDGGAGILRALGARVLDAHGRDLPPGGGALARAERLDLSGLHPLARRARFSFACDVDNPLLGPDGAAAVYGPQKGADPRQVKELDAALARWAAVLGRATGRDPATITAWPGAGAAGGAACGLGAVLGATRQSGAGTVLALTGFPAALDGARLVVTGEGRLDRQTLHGKAPAAVAAAAAESGVPAIAVTGECLLTEDQWRAAGFEAVYALLDLASDRQDALSNTAALLRRTGRLIGGSVP